MLKATLIGNLGGDPEMRYSAGGTPLLRFNIATNTRVKDQDGEYRDRTEWVRATVIGQRAENIASYLRKGSRVYVEGRLEARPWTDNQNQIRAGLEVVVNEIQFMSRPQDEEGASSTQQAVRRSPSVQAVDLDDDLEDLPF